MHGLNTKQPAAKPSLQDKVTPRTTNLNRGMLVSKQPSPKNTCHQTSISTLQISWKDTDSGPPAVTCCQPQGQKSQLSLPPLQVQGTVCPWEPARHCQAARNTPSIHPTWGSGAMVPVALDRWQTTPQSNGGTPAEEAAALAEYCSRGRATPPAIQAALQWLQGLRKPGLGQRKVHPPRAVAAHSRGGATARLSAPPTALPYCCSTSPSRRQPHGTNRDCQHYGHWGQILLNTDPASVGQHQLTQGRSRAGSCGRTRCSVLNRCDASGSCVGFIAD